MSMEKPIGDEVPYTFIIQTGSSFPDKSYTEKWDDGTMILTINPGGGSTESKDVRITELFPMWTEGDVTVDFWLPKAIGVPKVLKVDLEGTMFGIFKDALYIREISILYNRDLYRFPIKNFLYPHSAIYNPTEPREGCPPHFLIREGAGTLKHLETEDFIIKARDEDLNMVKSMVKWNNDGEDSSAPALLFPGTLKDMKSADLPRFLKFRDATLDAGEKMRKPGESTVMKNALKNMVGQFFKTYKVKHFESFDQYCTYLKKTADKLGWEKATVHETLKMAKIFRQDEEFGRQLLCGPNPWMIRQVSSLEGRWSETTVPGHALQGKSLEQVLEEGHLFEVSYYDDLINIPHGGKMSKSLTGTAQTWYMCPAECLLYQRNDGMLVPVLIRLENTNDGESATFWSPPKPEITDLDHPEHLAWLWAKMWFRSADVNHHSLITHYGRAHATNEVFAVAIYRNLPNAHPIFRLLQPHILGVIAINCQAREIFLKVPESNALACVISAGDNYWLAFDNHYKTFTYDDLIAPEVVKKRGTQHIPEYLFRDDYLANWEIIQEYVEEIVNLTYPSDEDVVLDTELQSLFEEVVKFGFHGIPNGAGFPKVVKKKEKLTEYLTAIIVNMSTFHAAVNFQVFTTFGYIPNTPSCMSLPPPKQGDTITMDKILKSLSVLEITFFLSTVIYGLGTFSPIENFFLGDLGANRRGMVGEIMTIGPNQEACVRRLIEKMRQLKEKIAARNVGRYLKYDVLSPDNIPLATQA